VLIAMAGLPATGKSCLAARLAQELGAVVLSKDLVRPTLFPPPVLDYSREQDDICMAAIHQAAAHIFKTVPGRTVILDGRTFSRSYQVRDLLALAEATGQPPVIIECVCADEIARQRLETALAKGEHPAGNRTYSLYRALKDTAEPIELPRLVLDTGILCLEECVALCLDYLKGR
jgi:predicted kinase